MKSWIYFARHGAAGPIKIGRAHDPRKRLQDLSVGSPVALVLLGAVLSERAEEEEDELHNRLDAHRVRGEWFEAEAVLQEMGVLRARFVMPDALARLESLHDSYDANMNIRVTPEELAAWKVAARATGMSLSQWARNVFNSCAEEDEEDAAVVGVAP